MLRIRNPKIVTRHYHDSPTIWMHNDGRNGDDARLRGCSPTRAVGASELDDEAFHDRNRPTLEGRLELSRHGQEGWENREARHVEGSYAA